MLNMKNLNLFYYEKPYNYYTRNDQFNCWILTDLSKDEFKDALSSYYRIYRKEIVDWRTDLKEIYNDIKGDLEFNLYDGGDFLLFGKDDSSSYIVELESINFSFNNINLIDDEFIPKNILSNSDYLKNVEHHDLLRKKIAKIKKQKEQEDQLAYEKKQKRKDKLDLLSKKLSDKDLDDLLKD